MKAAIGPLLIGRLRAGDSAALEVLMEQQAARLYQVAYGITRNHADAEEVVQDVCLTLFRKIDSFEGRAALGTWLYRVAVNAALNKCRGRRTHHELQLREYVPTFGEDRHREGDRSFLLADRSQGPEAELLSAETRAALHRAIGKLPERYRAVLVLRDIEQVSSDGAARVLRVSVACVKSRLHRARVTLREIYTGLGQT